jgi:two-component system response regulator HupR/HoxA
MVANRQFREDLFYRVNVLKITLPALRDRATDIPTLVEHFIRKHRRAGGNTGDELPRPTDAAMALLVGYPWPGNIRELENEIERALVLGGDTVEIGPELLSQRIRDAAAAPPVAARTPPRELTGTLREMIERVESEVILAGLIRTHWNKSQLAKELGISRSYLIQKCTYYGLERKDGG